MKLTMTDSGASYLRRMEGNRERLSITHVSFGTGSNYEVSPNQLGLRGEQVHRQPIDSVTIEGDVVTVVVLLDVGTAFSYGEVSLHTTDGGLIAVGSFPALQDKRVSTITTLTLTLEYGGLGEALTRVSKRAARLLRTKTDWEDAKTQLQAIALEKSDFGVLVTNETGNTLIELLAGVVDLNGYMAESAFQEAFPHLAKLDTSIYSAQIMLKNRLTRKRPASATFKLTRPENYPSQAIPALSQWYVDGIPMFNRETILLKKRLETSKDIILHQGTVHSYAVNGNGKDFQFWQSNHKDFSVSDKDVLVKVNGVTIPVIEGGIWEHKDKPAVQDFTYNDGSLVLTFGNANYGTLPEQNDRVLISYAVTEGMEGNITGFIGKEGSISTFPDVKVVATTDLTSGGNPPTASTYSNFGGDLFGAQRGAVTPSQHRALAASYPGVKDAIVLAQRDLSPLDQRWFNVGKVILLTDGDWSQQQLNDFEEWFRQRVMYSMRWIITSGNNGQEPRKRSVDVKATIYCKPTADLQAVQRSAESSVRNLFVPRQGILARPVYRTDIIQALKAAFPNAVDYIILHEPTKDISMYLETPKIKGVKVSTGGTLPIGQYRWAVSAVDSQGESRIDYVDFEVTEPDSSVTIEWAEVKSAVSYNIFGRSRGQIEYLGLIGTSNTTSWTDDGSSAGTNQKPPSINTSGVHYAVAGTIQIDTDYSTRSALEDTAHGFA